MLGKRRKPQVKRQIRIALEQAKAAIGVIAEPGTVQARKRLGRVVEGESIPRERVLPAALEGRKRSIELRLQRCEFLRNENVSQSVHRVSPQQSY